MNSRVVSILIKIGVAILILVALFFLFEFVVPRLLPANF